jgi:hypothetical protein
MLDNDLINLLATSLEAATKAGAWLDATGAFYGVSQKDQPTQQGIPTVPQVFFEKLFDIPYGYPQLSYSYDSVNNVMTETETQLVETTFQISAFVIQDPTDLTIPTASDVANFIRSYITSRFNLRGWKAQNVNVLRVTRVTNPYIEDDRHRNEAAPSFDLVMTHQRTIANPSNFAETMDGQDVIVQQ